MAQRNEERAAQDNRGGSNCVRGKELEYFAAMLRRIEGNFIPAEIIQNWARGLKRAEFYPSTWLARQELRDELARQDEIRAERRENHPPAPEPLRRRLTRHLVNLAKNAASARGITTPTGWRWDVSSITDRDRDRGMWMVHSEYRHHYSNSFGDWWQGASYLCGRDDGGVWVMRIPRTITKISAALDYITPSAVRRARAEGRWVARQGDVWLVELRAGRDNLGDLPISHDYDPDRRELRHDEHAVVRVPDHVRAIRAYTQIAVHGDAD